jgi:hypothetical protein
MARSVFWLGLVYSSMPFDGGSSGPVTLPGPLAACVHGMSEDCRSAVERLRLAADAAAVSVQAGDVLRKAATTSHLADAPRLRDKVFPTRSSFVQPADSR